VLLTLLGKAAAQLCPAPSPSSLKAKISNYCSAENIKSIIQLFIIPGFVIFHIFFYTYLLAFEKDQLFPL
jgi:hypothetical protein